MCVATGCEGDLTTYRGDDEFIGDDLSRPNEAFWQHIDFIIQAALDRNMAVMFNPIWIRHHRERDESGSPDTSPNHAHSFVIGAVDDEPVLYAARKQLTVTAARRLCAQRCCR